MISIYFFKDSPPKRSSQEQTSSNSEGIFNEGLQIDQLVELYKKSDPNYGHGVKRKRNEKLDDEWKDILELISKEGKLYFLYFSY